MVYFKMANKDGLFTKVLLTARRFAALRKNSMPILKPYFKTKYCHKKGMPVLHPFGDENSSSSNSACAGGVENDGRSGTGPLMDNTNDGKGEPDLNNPEVIVGDSDDSNISSLNQISSEQGDEDESDNINPAELDTGVSNSNSANDDGTSADPLRRMLCINAEEEPLENEFRISDKEAIRCALSIPEEFVPTPHKDFLAKKEKERKMIAPLRSKKLSIQDGGVKTGFMVNGKSIVVRERERKLRSAFAKYKKWDENEKSKVECLENNKVIVNGTLVIDVDHTNYIKETEVILEYDEDYKTCEMPPLPGTASPCELSSCRLGCICDSIKQDPIPRTHCGKPKCFFECSCQQSLFANGDDGDIRSRLRPRVSLLNWRYMESTEREKDPPPANYRQLERGAAIYPRMRRVPVAPQRFRNEYVMSHKFDTFGRDRRKTVPGGITKFMRNKPIVVNSVKRDNHGGIYRRNYVVKSNIKSKDSTSPKCKPCTVSIDPIKSHSTGKRNAMHESKLSDNQAIPQVQPELPIPPLIQAMTEDGQVLLLGETSMCFFAWSLRAKHPRAILYEETDGDVVPIPWLYVPVPSFGEAWIFHHVNKDILAKTTFSYIPEINCVIPSKALQVHFNTATLKQKTVALKILWIGQDSRKRMGSIYIFPQLPGCLVCGPFPKNQMRTRYGSANSQERIDSAINLGNYIDEISKKRFMGDEQSWNTFFSSKSKELYNSLKENVQKSPGIPVGPDMEPPPREMFYDIAASTPKREKVYPPQRPQVKMRDNHSVTITPVPIMPKSKPVAAVRKPAIDKLRVSWNDAARIYSVNSVRSTY